MRSLPQLDRSVEEIELAALGLGSAAAYLGGHLAYRQGGRQVDVLYDLCSHLSGPLSEGVLSGAGDAMCITCPWHGSTFRLRDGQVQRGPTTYPQPVLQVRVDPDGSVQARLREDD